MRVRGVLALVASLAPTLGGAQLVILGSPAEAGGTVVGRVCVDADADGRCGAGDPGIAGARLLAEGGQVALADGEGKFHLLEMPGRTILPDRAAYGGHVVTVEGLGVREAFELPPGGAARLELPVPSPPAPSGPTLSPAGGPGGAPELLPDGRLRWDLGGRTAPGAWVALESGEVAAAPDGSFSASVILSPGANVLLVAVVEPDGAAAAFVWTVHFAPRSGLALVVPEAPKRIVELVASPGAGGGALLTGRAAPSTSLRIGGVLAAVGPGGAFAGWAPAGSPPLEVVVSGKRVLARVPPPSGRVRGVAAVSALAELEVSLFGDPGVLVSARGAGAARGRLGPVAYEFGVDLDERDRRGDLADLLRPRDALQMEHALDPERSFSPGDEGAAGDGNPGRGRLWGRLEAEGARVDVGSTRTGLTEPELGRYDRAIFGASALGVGEVGPLRLEAKAFGASAGEDTGGNPPPRPAHDVLAATGGAAFWLSHGEVVPGSEALRVEWRDPVTGRTTEGRTLVRGEDYEIDWLTGRVVLAAPLATVRGRPSVATGDPFAAPRAALLADYLHATATAGGEDVQGGRVVAALGPVELSAHGVNEERSEGGYRLAAAGATLDLGPRLRVRAEAARSRGFLFARGGTAGFSRSPDGGYSFAGTARTDGEADAFHLEARGAAGPLRLQGWWREREVGYSDGEFAEESPARERGAEAVLGEGPVVASVLWAERRGSDPFQPGAGALDEERVVARAGWRAGRLGLQAEAVRVVREEPVDSEETSAGIRASWEIDPSFVLDLSHHQGLRTTGAGVDPTFTAAGGTFAQGRTALSVRGGWGPEIGPRVLVGGERSSGGEAVYGTFTADPDAPSLLGEAASALGARRREGATEIFVEEQFARDAFGLRASRVLGAALEPLRGVRLSLSGERGERLRLDGSLVDREAVAGTAALVLRDVRLAARGEARHEGADEQTAAGASAEWKAARGLVFAIRASLVSGRSAGREGLALDVALSGTFRADGWSVLASLARLAEKRPGEARRDGVVARLASTLAATDRLDLGLGGGLSLQEVGGGRDDRVAGSARVRLRVRGPFDTALEYARRAPLRGGGGGALDAVRAEAGVSERENRLAVGYTFLGFAGDGLTPAADTSRLYVRVQLVY